MLFSTSNTNFIITICTLKHFLFKEKEIKIIIVIFFYYFHTYKQKITDINAFSLMLNKVNIM